ncbi:MAG: hypothetical protein OEZ13_09625 [Spirochaetia bacterium]|nr:hypothetical protein [Spirochaetia bacterium]
MKNILKIILILMTASAMNSTAAQESRVDDIIKQAPDNMKEKMKKYLSVSTKEAQDMIIDFSDMELVNMKQAYENVLNNAKDNEKRVLWLYQAAEARKADKIAADRLFYVALALILLMTLFTTFVGYIYFAQRRLISHMNER